MHPKIVQNGGISTAIIAIDNIIFYAAKGTKFKVLQKVYCNLLQFHFHIIASTQ